MGKKILFINGHLNAGGVERSLVDVLQHIDYTKYDVDLLLLQGKGDYAAEIPAEVRVHEYDTDKAYGPFLPIAFKLLLHRNLWHLWYRLIIQFFGYQRLAWAMPELRGHYDTAIAYRPGICTDILASVVKSSNKICWWHHGEMNLSQPEQSRLAQNYRSMQHLVVVSESIAQLIRTTFPESASKVSVIPNMLPIDAIMQKAEAESDVVFRSIDKFRIVSVGRLSPEKNMIFCINVAKQLTERQIPFEWIIVGDGSEWDNIKRAISEAHLDDSVVLAGALSNPYPLMRKSDMLFHPSLVESQGLTVLEAMALGTPVVCVRSAGPQEFICSGENGVLIENDEDEALAAIMQMNADAQWRKSMAEKAKETINAFDPKVIIQKIETLL